MAGKVEIQTAHNIVVNFHLALFSDRILATLVDLTVMSVLSIVVSLLGIQLGLANLSYVLIFFLFAFYHLLFEIFNSGQSLGKMLCKIKVLNLKGKPPNHAEAFQRWVFRMLDITFSLGALGGLYITSSPVNQRLGDLMGGCVVIKMSKDSFVPFDRVARIQDRDHEILYPRVSMYSEDDMILIKDVLQRSTRVKNQSIDQVIIDLSQRIEQDLQVRIDMKGKRKFLEDVLRDYVSITR